jgi:hypothetical protein
MSSSEPTKQYVAYCDVLGFSAAVISDFEATIWVYREFMEDVRKWPFPPKARVSVYSDSILVVGSELPPVLHTVNALCWATLRHKWLIRGGVAYGRYWEETENGNVFVVSDALVRAAAIERTVKVPAVALGDDISLGIEAWVPRFEHGIFKAPLLFYEGRTIVNPFGHYWFNSATIHVAALRETHPMHKDKYDWFLALANAVARDEILVPEAALTEMLKLGILVKRDDPANVNAG